MLLRALFDRDIEVAEADPHLVDPDELAPAERAQVATAVLKRRQEYAAGRLLARSLLSRLGVPAQTPLLAGEDRAPRWPEGFVGSISHCDDLAVVAVARADLYASIGCDVEAHAPLPEGVAERVVCTATERASLGTGASRHVLARMIFSAKEAIYKLQYPLTRAFLDFCDLEVSLDVERGIFEARLHRSAGCFASGHCFRGRLAVTDRHIATGAILRITR